MVTVGLPKQVATSSEDSSARLRGHRVRNGDLETVGVQDWSGILPQESGMRFSQAKRVSQIVRSSFGTHSTQHFYSKNEHHKGIKLFDNALI